MKKKIIVLIVATVLLIGITFLAWPIATLSNVWLKRVLAVLLNLSNGAVAFIAIKLTGIKLDLDIPSTSIIKGDLLSQSIAAASVIAKVTRDNMMYELSKKYPNYGFDKHKGYPTKKHIEAIKKYGLIDGYRKSYGPIKEVIKR